MTMVECLAMSAVSAEKNTREEEGPASAEYEDYRSARLKDLQSHVGTVWMDAPRRTTEKVAVMGGIWTVTQETWGRGKTWAGGTVAGLQSVPGQRT